MTTSPSHFLPLVLLAMQACRTPDAAAAAPLDATPARQALRDGRHAEAFGRFAALADAGDAASADTALWMLRHGPELFGSDWWASEAQLRHWRGLAASSQGQCQPIDNSTMGLRRDD